MNKTSKVLQHLQDHGSITSNEAWELYGATRLSAIIFNLRKRGHDIETVTMGMTDRYGNAVNYAKYVLHKDSQEQLPLE
jgi:hypothetical protein